MMDFDNILDIASQNQGLSSVQPKRYSLQAGPPKKDPKSRAVNPAAVQALLKKQQFDSRRREIEMKKEKEKLNAKRVEMKSDRKARAMASRTKDNFKGYNGVPLLEAPKKRRSKQDAEDAKSMHAGSRNDSADPEDDEDNYEYDQTDSETEPEPLRTARPTAVGRGSSRSGGKSSSNKAKPAPPPLNFADLLKLAEKKQFEPVDLKPKAMKKEERLRTAEEIREQEMERKAKRPEKNRDGQSSTSASEKEQRNGRPQKNSSAGSGRKVQSDRGPSSSKSSVRDGDRPKTSHSNKDRSKANVSLTSSGATNAKVLSKPSPQGLTKQRAPKPTASHRSSTSSDLRKESTSFLQGRAAGSSGTRPSGTASPGFRPQQTRPSQGGAGKQAATVGGHRAGKGEPVKTGMSSAVKPNVTPATRSPAGGPPKAGGHPQQRPGATFQAKGGGAHSARPGGSGVLGQPRSSAPRPPGPGRGRPGAGGPVPGCSTSVMGSGPGRPKCTVVSETISSKNFGGPRPGVPARPGMPPTPGVSRAMMGRAMMGRAMMGRAMMGRAPGPMLPPITSAYKRRYEEEDDEYDSEMDDFIDDEGNEPEEISRHIKEIFGYDRSKYKDESDYALRFMESSWKDMQKEEARSLKMAVLEDLEEEKKEQEELKRRSAKRPKKN